MPPAIVSILRGLVIALLAGTIVACASAPDGIRSRHPSGATQAGLDPDGDGSDTAQGSQAEEPGRRIATAIEPVDPPSEPVARLYRRKAAETLSRADVPVRSGPGDFMGAVADIDADGSLDLALLIVDETFADLADSATLADTSRLYRPEARTPHLWLVVFSRVEDEPVERHRFSIGRRRVATGVEVRPLRLDESAPAAFVVPVITRDGTEDYWFAFSRGGIASATVVDNTGSTRTAVTDIEDNNHLDFLRYQPVFEQGRTADTLITWTRWTELGFETVETTNIVRNLTRFLDRANRILSRGALAEFTDHAMKPDTLRSLTNAGHSVEQLIDSLFLPESESGPGPPAPGQTTEPGDPPDLHRQAPSLSRLINDRVVQQVVFPQVTRSPFPEIGRETSFRTTVRVMTTEPADNYFEVEIGMAANPFLPQQFFFRPIND